MSFAPQLKRQLDLAREKLDEQRANERQKVRLLRPRAGDWSPLAHVISPALPHYSYR